MPGVIIENLSGKKLSVLIAGLVVCQFACFLIGGFAAPNPSNADHVLATKCYDPGNNSDAWFYVRGKGSCQRIDNYLKENHLNYANRIVFAFQIPLPRDNVILDYSRWQQNLIGVVQLDVAYYSDAEMALSTLLTLDAKLAYRNEGDPENEWKFYASSLEERIVECSMEVKKEGDHYNCSIIPLFELGSLHHDYYLLNIRLPVDHEMNMNVNLGQVEDMWLVAINQNGGFTKIWLSLKTLFFPCIIAIMVWFWKRVHQLSRTPVLLEYMLLSLGSALTLLNTPFELITLFYDFPFMILLADIRQGVFYAALLSFWLVFAGEHLMIQDNDQRNQLRTYWKHLSGVFIGCLSLFIFDLCERGTQLVNPFYSIWVTNIGTNVALTFITVAMISAGIYFIFLCYMIWQVFGNISMKKQALPSMSNVRRLHYEGIIYRFKFLMLVTLLCAAMTIIGFILGQASEGKWKWDDDLHLDYTSGFFTGVYGMWNIYIFALMVLYAPSHKQWPSEMDMNMATTEEIEFSPLSHSNLHDGANEISALTSFARKAAFD